MLNKPFFLVLFLLIIIQILFSFYYSSEIITQNNLINKNQTILETLEIENQDLEEKFASASSLKQIQNSISQKNYINLKEKLNLQN